MMYAACGEAAHTPAHGVAARVPRYPMPVISDGLPAAYLRDSTMVGPLAIYPADSEYPNLRRDDFAPVTGDCIVAASRRSTRL
jgi:hypothetical protein